MVHGSSTWINPPPWNTVIIKPVDIISSAFHTDPWSQPGHQKLQRSELRVSRVGHTTTGSPLSTPHNTLPRTPANQELLVPPKQLIGKASNTLKSRFSTANPPKPSENSSFVTFPSNTFYHSNELHLAWICSSLISCDVVCETKHTSLLPDITYLPVT